MYGDEEGGEQRQVQPFIFSSIGKIFDECPLCAGHKLRCIGEQDAHDPCFYGAHSQLVKGMSFMLLWQTNGLFNFCPLFMYIGTLILVNVNSFFKKNDSMFLVHTILWNNIFLMRTSLFG